MDFAEEKKSKGQKRTGLPFLTAEDILNVGENSSQVESPINLSFDIMKEVRMSPIEWENFEVTPKLMKISNSGTTAILSAKWNGPRPFLANGPMSGKYVFSQLHFHWGRSFQEGSEHRFNGESLPLEMHAMFFKNVYMCQDEAMKKSDGIITLAYFFHLQEEDNENLTSITNVLPNIAVPLTSQHIEAVPLKTVLPPFSSDYFLYWGNVANMSVLWIICRKPLSISKMQLMLFQKMMGSDMKTIEKNFREPKELNQRMVFHVNPSDHKLHPLLPLKYGESKKSSTVHKVYNVTGIYPERVDQAENELGSILKIEDGNYDSELIDLSLKKQTSIKDLKYTLAKMLLDLEKKEDNDDFGVLENYLKVKYKLAHEKFQAESRLVSEKKEEIKENDEFQINDNHLSNTIGIEDAHPTNCMDNKEDNVLVENSISKLMENKSSLQSREKNEENSQGKDKHGRVYSEESDTTSTRLSSSYSGRYSDRRCMSASEKRDTMPMKNKSINKFGIKSSGFPKFQDSCQVITPVQMKFNDIQSVQCCEIEHKVTELRTNKSDEFSLVTSEVMSSGSEKTKQSSRISSSDETIHGNESGQKSKKEYDIQALRERLLSRRLKRNIPAVGTTKRLNLKRINSPKKKDKEEDVEKTEISSIASKQATEDEDRYRKRAMIRKSMMRILKDRPDGKETLPKKPKSPDRPAWKP